MSRISKMTQVNNSAERNVVNHSIYLFNSFLCRSSGNMLINGGMKDKRRKCLADYIRFVSSKTKTPVIVFSRDKMLEEMLVNFAKSNVIGRLDVCSPEFPGYDFFAGLDTYYICEFFSSIAKRQNVNNTAELINYISAFLSIASEYSVVDLPAMLELAEKTDDQIKSAATDEKDKNAITASVQGGILFRNILKMFAKKTSALRSEDNGILEDINDAFCISESVTGSSIMFINDFADDVDMLSVYFATVLRSVVNKRFICIFDDSIILNTPEMQTAVSLMKQSPGIDVVISHENIVSIDDIRDNSILKNFNRNVIFLNGTAPQADLQKVLDLFGEYLHMQEVASSTTPQKLVFSVTRSDSESTTTFMKKRILLQEEAGKEAVLTFGSDSTLHMVADLKN